MGDRNTKDLADFLSWDEGVNDTQNSEESASFESETSKKKRKKDRTEAQHQPEIYLHCPQPTSLSAVLQEVAKWSDLNFVMDPALNRSIQIFAPRKMDQDEAFQVFVASLETIGLRALHLQGRVVKIVPISLGKFAV